MQPLGVGFVLEPANAGEMSRIEELAEQVLANTIEVLSGHVDEMDHAQIIYLAETVVRKALMPFVDEMVDLRTRTESYAHGHH